ncbi:hypothetical protein [Bacteroides sp. An19]|uniref:hypothetical protein n=1 Tax=Bacteroides sp. An19 TaxID=1965580 RepID=UPI000B39929A|nr:hypothetical protein [Bacteroides sp. An19]OUP26895.1 hypothetical protein B5F25_19760 [Bacteroides sp. An19]
MKDFDNFQSWAEVEGDYFSKFRKYPHFDNDYLWIKNKKLFSCGIFFYYSYYHFGRSFLGKKLEVLNLPRKETINQLIGLCDDFIHEIMIDFYEEHYFTFIKDALVQKIIRDNSPITEDSIKEYIVSKNADLRIKSKAVGYMIVICFSLSDKPAFSKYFGVEVMSFILGTKFEDIFNFISLHNKPLYKYIFYIKKSISEGLHSIGFFDDYDPNEESSGPLSYIPNNFYLIKNFHNKIPWKFVTFLNGELQIFNPRHPDGQGKYKPFYYRTEKSIKAFRSCFDFIR